MEEVKNVDRLDIECEKRSKNLLFIRLLAALLVIFSHAFPIALGSDIGEPIKNLTFGALSLGNLAVATFFILGGFLITQSFLRTDNVVSFFKARILRLFPALIVVITITVFIIGPIFTTLSLKEYFTNPDTYRYFLNCVLCFIDNLPGVFTNLSMKSINGSLWTLAYEFLCYIIVALLGIFGLLKRKEIPLGLFFLVLLAYLFRYNLFFEDTLFLGLSVYQLLELTMYFLFGCVVYLYRDKIEFSWTAFFVSLSVLFFGFFIKQYALSFCIFGGYCLFFLSYSSKVKLPDVSKLGDISYGIYIFGFLVQQILVSLFGGKMNPYANTFLSLIIVFPLAILSYYFIEKPCLKLKKVNILEKLFGRKVNKEKISEINLKIKQKYNLVIEKTNKFAACWIVVLLFVLTTVFGIASTPSKCISFDYKEKNDYLFSEGFYDQQENSDYRWINKKGSVKILFPKQSRYLVIEGYSPEHFTEVNRITIYIGKNVVHKEDISVSRSFQLKIDISSFTNDYYSIVQEVTLEFNDVHIPSSEDTDVRKLSGIVWRIEVLTAQDLESE